MIQQTEKSISIEFSGNNIKTLDGDDALEIFNPDNGGLRVRRFSLVEFDDPSQSWQVQSLDGQVLAGGFSLRRDALKWEHDELGPGSKYWSMQIK